MGEVQKIFTDILCAKLCGKPLDIQSPLTSEIISSLYKLSKAHDLAHIVSSALSSLGALEQNEMSAKFQKEEMLAIYRCERMKSEYERICQTLDNANIQYIPLKGSVIRPYYPYDSMRTSSDIDIFIKKEDIPLACEKIEQSLSYTRKSKYFSEITYVSPSSVNLELHFFDANTSTEDFLIFDNIWEHTVKSDGCKYLLDNQYFLLYHILHMAKHFSHGGCGIRPFMDLWIMENKMNIARNCADSLLKNAGYNKFAAGAFALCDVWFNNKEHTDFTLDMQDFIFGGGVYGSLENNIILNRGNKKTGIGYMLKRVFLPYKHMVLLFPSLKYVPFLLPFYYIARCFGLIFRGKIKHGINVSKINNNLSQEQIDKVYLLTKALGLKD